MRITPSQRIEGQTQIECTREGCSWVGMATTGTPHVESLTNAHLRSTHPDQPDEEGSPMPDLTHQLPASTSMQHDAADDPRYSPSSCTIRAGAAGGWLVCVRLLRGDGQPERHMDVFEAAASLDRAKGLALSAYGAHTWRQERPDYWVAKHTGRSSE